MSTFDQLYRASFKGARFIAVGAPTASGGRKLIDHVYPNSDRRFIEDLGKSQRDFTLTGEITGPNYFAKKKQLMNALETTGAGRLSHPFFGSMNVVARPYTVTEPFNRINVAIFQLSFSIPSENIFPTNAGLFNFSSFADSLTSSIDSFINTDYSIDFSENLLAAENVMNSVFDKFDDISRNVNVLKDNFATFKKIISNARDKIASIIRDPSLLFDFFDSAFAASNNMVATPADGLKLLRSLYGFTGGDSTLTPLTVIRAEQIKNNKVINDTVNTLALSNSYVQANLVDFNNDEELIEISEIIETQFESIEDGLNDPVISSLYILRSEFRSFVENLLVTIDKVETINTEKMPVLVLAYQYYGSTENYDDIIDLNLTLNPSEISGEVKILTL